MPTRTTRRETRTTDLLFSVFRDENGGEETAARGTRVKTHNRAMQVEPGYVALQGGGLHDQATRPQDFALRPQNAERGGEAAERPVQIRRFSLRQIQTGGARI